MARAKLDPRIEVAEAKARLLEWGKRGPARDGPRLPANPIHLALAALAAGFVVSALFKRRRGGLFLMTALFGRTVIRTVLPIVIGALVKRAAR
jgi:hypothetical protein